MRDSAGTTLVSDARTGFEAAVVGPARAIRTVAPPETRREAVSTPVVRVLIIGRNPPISSDRGAFGGIRMELCERGRRSAPGIRREAHCQNPLPTRCHRPVRTRVLALGGRPRACSRTSPASIARVPSVKRWGRPSTRRATASSEGAEVRWFVRQDAPQAVVRLVRASGPGCRRLGLAESRTARRSPTAARLAQSRPPWTACAVPRTKRWPPSLARRRRPSGLRSLRSRASLSRLSPRSPSPPSPTWSPPPW